MAKGLLREGDEMPEVTHFQFYISAFNELSTSRPVGMEAGYIPFTAILEYFKVYPVASFEDFLYLIRVMDREYMSKQEKKGATANVTNSSTDDSRKS